MRHDVSNGESRMGAPSSRHLPWALDSVADRGERSIGRKRQSGSVLIFVMAMVLVLSIAVVAVLTRSLNTDIVAVKLEESTKHDHKVDGVLEDVVNEVRNDDSDCQTNMSVSGFVVDCVSQPGAEPDTRTADLTVIEGGSSVVGKARILLNDNPTTGYTIDVCDWLLSRNVTESLRRCS